MYWTKYLWYCWDFSSTPAVIRRPHSDSAPVELFPFSHPRCASGLRRRIFILCEKKPAYESFDQAIHSGTLITVSQLAMDFSNLWKDCYRFIMLLFTQCTSIRGLLLSAITVSLHYLPRCLCSTATCRAPIQLFQINPYCTPKKTYSYNKNRENMRYEQKHMTVLICIETIIEYWFNSSSYSKFSSAIRTTFLLFRTFYIAGNILRWWYLSLIVGMHLLLN